MRVNQTIQMYWFNKRLDNVSNYLKNSLNTCVYEKGVCAMTPTLGDTCVVRRICVCVCVCVLEGRRENTISVSRNAGSVYGETGMPVSNFFVEI